MLAAVLSGFVLSLIAPWLQKIGKKATGWIIALLPAGLFLYFTSFIAGVAEGETALISYAWVPTLDISLSFYVDGLSLLFALIITGIGALIAIYGGGYLAHHHLIGRFYAYFLMFMASMLGVVLSSNVVTLFVFWELTSITSFLLIGYYHEKPDSRFAALQALLVTGAGGLALLAGLVMVSLIGGSWEIAELLSRGEIITASPLYPLALTLILAGAFTKSAQFPFHFWLPGAMAAPAPVSAYLHSATMVKAGVYLLARMSPILGGTGLWLYTVTGFGAVTMLVGAHIAWQQTDLKRILAYSTVSALGILVMLLGLGGKIAAEAAILFLIVHSLYKGSLFMVAGAVDHETGVRHITHLGGLRRVMPITAVAAGLAALSMSGLPPFFGFFGKELIYEATLETHLAAILITAVAVLTNILTIIAAGMVAINPFFGEKVDTPKHAHEAPLSMWLGPLTLAGLGLLFGLASTEGIKALIPLEVDHLIVSPAAAAIIADKVELHLALWHGFTPMLMLSVVTVLGGIGLYTVRPFLKSLAAPLNVVTQWGPEKWYQWSLDGMLAVARFQTGVLQSGYLRYYLLTIIVTTVGLTGYTLFREVPLSEVTVWRSPQSTIYEMVVALIILAATVVVVRAQSRLAAVAALGVVGYGVALFFILFGAPDLAMTQFSIETLSVILLVLVLYKLPRYILFANTASRLRDLLVALSGGALMTLLVLIVTGLPSDSRLTPYFAANSFELAKGHNVVNVILVDFRGFDTMGEITVLGIAAIGVFGLLKLRLEKNGDAGENATTPESTGIYPSAD